MGTILKRIAVVPFALVFAAPARAAKSAAQHGGDLYSVPSTVMSVRVEIQERESLRLLLGPVSGHTPSPSISHIVPV